MPQEPPLAPAYPRNSWNWDILSNWSANWTPRLQRSNLRSNGSWIRSLLQSWLSSALVTAWRDRGFSRFDSPDKILAYAGASASTYQSGQLESSYSHMEKRGSRYFALLSLMLPSASAIGRNIRRISSEINFWRDTLQCCHHPRYKETRAADLWNGKTGKPYIKKQNLFLFHNTPIEHRYMMLCLLCDF